MFANIRVYSPPVREGQLFIVSAFTSCKVLIPFLFSSFFSADTYDQGGLQEVQLEDGSTAYIQHTVHMPQSNTILAIQADGTIADLQTEATALDHETISVLEQYTTKVSVGLLLMTQY